MVNDNHSSTDLINLNITDYSQREKAFKPLNLKSHEGPDESYQIPSTRRYGNGPDASKFTQGPPMLASNSNIIPMNLRKSLLDASGHYYHEGYPSLQESATEMTKSLHIMDPIPFELQ